MFWMEGEIERGLSVRTRVATMWVMVMVMIWLMVRVSSKFLKVGARVLQGDVIVQHRMTSLFCKG